MKRVLFLDIDGVLNSASSMLGLDARSWPHEDVAQTGLNPISCGLLKRLLNDCKITHIYVHSTWAGGDFNHDYFTLLLTHYEVLVPGLDVRVLPLVHTNQLNREQRIDQGLKAYDVVKDGGDYMILDDVNMTVYGENMFHCDPMHGFSYREYRKACEYFHVAGSIVML